MEKCREIIDFLNTHAYGFEIILNEPDEQFIVSAEANYQI